MRPRVKFGLIVGGIGLVFNIIVATALGICGPLTALVAGAVAGFLSARQEKAPTQGDGGRLGAVAGGIAGGLVFIGQIFGAIAALALVQFSGSKPSFGTAPNPSAPISQQILYYFSGLGVGACFGLIGFILAIVAGAGAGYLGTSKPSSSDINLPTNNELSS